MKRRETRHACSPRRNRDSGQGRERLLLVAGAPDMRLLCRSAFPLRFNCIWLGPGGERAGRRGKPGSCGWSQGQRRCLGDAGNVNRPSLLRSGVVGQAGLRGERDTPRITSTAPPSTASRSSTAGHGGSADLEGRVPHSTPLALHWGSEGTAPPTQSPPCSLHP